MHSNLSGPTKAICYREVSTIQRLFYIHSNLSDPTKAVCYREVFTIRVVCYKRFHCIYIIYIWIQRKVL